MLTTDITQTVLNNTPALGFLAQESILGAIYSYFDVFAINTVGVDGTYVFDSNWFVGLNYQCTGIGNTDFNTYGIELGYYVNKKNQLLAFLMMAQMTMLKNATA